jgi:hypothetical protein
MNTLILSSRILPATNELADAARKRKWHVFVVGEDHPRPEAKLVFYGGTDLALPVAKQFGLALLEPTFDLLARLPRELLQRSVEFARFSDLGRLRAATFVKPADALNKSFDAGVYSNIRDIRAPMGVDSRSPVLLSEPVEWSAEYRCFILEGKIAAWSPYISFGRPVWKPFAPGTLADDTPGNLTAFCQRLFLRSSVAFPPAFVLDVGMIDDRGWGVVEFNPVWCSGLLGADPAKVLAVLDRACQSQGEIASNDRQWVMDRPWIPGC